MTIRIFDPTVESRQARHFDYAPRPKSLAGLRIGLVDNSKVNSDQLLARIAGLLESDYGVQTHVMRRKSSSAVPASRQIIDEFMAHCDVVIAGVGDCTCSAGSVLDSIVFEQQGMPSVSIVTDMFQKTGEAMAQTSGRKDFRFLSLPHPIANLTGEQLDQRARDIVPQIVKLLLEGQPAN